MTKLDEIINAQYNEEKVMERILRAPASFGTLEESLQQKLISYILENKDEVLVRLSPHNKIRLQL